MLNFEFYSPTRVVFGRGVVSKLGEECAVLGRKALFVYGRESIKSSGLYDEVRRQLQAAGIEAVDHGGVSANPVLSHALEGVEKAKSAGVDFILGVGGGSVIDESKGIAAGIVSEVPLWDLYSKKAAVSGALPVAAVQTLPATSSETNQASVLTNNDTGEKFGLRSPFIVPVLAFLDPELTFTVPLNYTAYACFDIMSHLLEGYFTTDADFSPVHDGFIEGLASAVKTSLERVLENPADYDARASIMWAGALAWNGMANAGLEGARIPNHMLEHPLSALYNVPHGAGLAVVMPAWLEYKKKTIQPKILRFGERILGLHDFREADSVIHSFRSWIKMIGAPSTFGELGINEPDIDELVRQAETLCRMWNIEASGREIESIYRSCM